jgi:hypothetical protein
LGGGFLAAALFFAAGGASAHGVPEGLRACARERDDAARLACFDRELARETGKTASAAAEEPPEQPLTAVVTRVAERSDGTFVVTLDNGQVWAQVKRAYIPLKAGDPVRIERGALGSIYLFTPLRRSTQVKRLK